MFSKEINLKFEIDWKSVHLADIEWDILLNKDRMAEREALARDNALPAEVFEQVSQTYIGIAEKIIGRPLHLSQNPKQEIIDVLKNDYGLID